MPVDSDRELVRDLAERLLAEHHPKTTPVTEFLGARFDLGLAWVHFPRGCGGLDLPRGLQADADAVLDAAGAPSAFARNPIGYGMAGPTVAAYGSDDQKARYLRPLYIGEEIWCQLFSEPSAGSDVAGLATSAVRDGDGWVVNGQKVWTSLAHVARWGLLLARTDPDVPKHQGLTYFVLDMRSPGVDVRPLRQLTGDAEFNEVYLTDVRVPDAERLGAAGEGWKVALTTLMNERTALSGGGVPRGGGAIAEALRLWHRHPERQSPVRRDRLVTLWQQAEVHRLTTQRAQRSRQQGSPGPEGSIGKLASAELNKRIYDFCVDFLGPEGVLYGSYEMGRRDGDADVQRRFLRSLANSIEGGTSEIMRNILGERVLGLPGEPRADRDRPWREVPRG